MEFDTEHLPQSIIIYIIVVGMFWLLPKMVGVTEWDLMIKIGITIAAAPLSYFIVPMIANK